MTSNITFNSTTALFMAMLVLAFYPGVSSLTVAARSATSGFKQGALTTLGIVIGDIIFILIAVYGLSFMAKTMDSLFTLIKYAGGAYLIWLGVTLWRSNSTITDIQSNSGTSALSSFVSGLLITLADIKAIFFYLGFFPAFLDLFNLSNIDIIIIIVISIVAVGVAKLSYAYLANKARFLLNQANIVTVLNLIVGSIMVCTGIFLIIKNHI